MKKLYDSSEGITIRQRIIGGLIVIPIIICFLWGLNLINEFLRDYYNVESATSLVAKNRGSWIICSILLSGCTLFWCLVRRSQVMNSENKERVPVNELSAGDVKFVGKVKSVGESIISPTGHDCVYYASYWLNVVSTGTSAEQGGSNHTSYVLVADDVRSSSFVITDESGEVELDLSDVKYQSMHGLWINEFEGIRSNNPKRSPIGGIVSSQYEEYNLKAGDNFYYNGAIGEFNYKDKTEITDLPPIIQTYVNRDKTEFSDLPPVISKKSEWTLPEIPAGTRKWKLEGGVIGNRTEEDIVSWNKRGMIVSLVFTIILWLMAISLHFAPEILIGDILGIGLLTIGGIIIYQLKRYHSLF